MKWGCEVIAFESCCFFILWGGSEVDSKHSRERARGPDLKFYPKRLAGTIQSQRTSIVSNTNYSDSLDCGCAVHCSVLLYAPLHLFMYLLWQKKLSRKAVEKGDRSRDNQGPRRQCRMRHVQSQFKLGNWDTLDSCFWESKRLGYTGIETSYQGLPYRRRLCLRRPAWQMKSSNVKPCSINVFFTWSK